MRRSRRALGWALAGVLAVASALATASAQAAPVTVTDARGHRLTLPAPPARIVSLLPSWTESLCALGGCAQLVGVDRYSNWPAQVSRLPQLGGLDDPQVEAIVRLRPDVVVIEPSARVGERLEALGLRVLRLKAETHAQMRVALTQLATLLGRPEAGAALWARIDATLDEAAAEVPAALRGAPVYFEVASTPYAAGAGSFIGQTLARLSLVNIVPEGMGPFPQINPEYVLRHPPQVIMAAQGAMDDIGRRPGWQRLPAVQRRQVCAFDAADYDLLVRPGPRLGEGARLMSACLRRISQPGMPALTR